MKTTMFLFTLLLGLLVGTTAYAQPVVPACNMGCAAPLICNPFDTNCQNHNNEVAQCQAQQSDCQAKFMLYDGYLTQMGAGVTMHTLPPFYRTILAPHYPNANLSEVRFGYSNRQPPNNATADCDRIYFNDAAHVEEMRTGTIKDQSAIHWMLHELRHFEQCREVGSRDAFAKMWWDHLSQTELQQLINTGGWTQVHDQMQMEQDADNRANTVLAALTACCIDPNVGIVPPLEVAPMVFSTNTPMLNEGLTVTVEANHGIQPYAYEWSWKRPPAGGFQTVSATPGTPNQVVLPLTYVGVYELKVRVLQNGGSLGMDVHEEVRSFEVAGPEVTNLEIIPNTVDGGSSTPATVYLTNLPPNQSVEIQLSSDNAIATVPATITATTNSYGTASQTFNIATGLTPFPRAAMIEARLGDSAASARLNVAAVTINMNTLDRIAVSRNELIPNEVFDLMLRLPRPAPGPIVVWLESSDTRTVSVPRQVRFEKGEQEKTLSLRTARTIPRAKSVTLRAHVSSNRQQQVEADLRVQPARSRRDR